MIPSSPPCVPVVEVPREARHLKPGSRRNVVVREIDGEGLLFDPESGDTHHLNETAFLIWQSCDGERSLGDIATRLSEEYDVSVEEAESRAARLLGELYILGLLERDSWR